MSTTVGTTCSQCSGPPNSSILEIGLDGQPVTVRPFSTRRVGGRPRADVGRTGRPTGPCTVLGMPLVSSLAGMLRYFMFRFPVSVYDLANHVSCRLVWRGN